MDSILKGPRRLKVAETHISLKNLLSPERGVKSHLPRRTRQKKHTAGQKSGTSLYQFSHTREIIVHRDGQRKGYVNLQVFKTHHI